MSKTPMHVFDMDMNDELNRINGLDISEPEKFDMLLNFFKNYETGGSAGQEYVLAKEIKKVRDYLKRLTSKTSRGRK